MSRITLLEMLLRAGLIDEKQFDEALQNRVLYGGKIGTSLIELGFVNEVDLARFLSRKLAVPYVSPEHLKNIPAETIAALPKALAVKYQAVPLKLDRKKLALAMVDPSDLKAVDEISFATGFIIRPVIAPEVRLIEALAVYYEAVVDPRYLEIAKRLEEERAGSATGHPGAAPPSGEAPPQAARQAETAAAAEMAAEMPAAGPLADAPLADADLLSAAETDPAEDLDLFAEPLPALEEPKMQDVEELPEVEEVAEPEERQPPEEPLPVLPSQEQEEIPEAEILEVVEADWVGRIERYSVDELSRKLARVEDREEIASVLMDYLGNRFDRSALFILRSGAAYGWKGAAGGKEIPFFKQFRLPLDSPSVLQAVAAGEELPVGAIPETVSDGLLREALGGGEPGAALALPLTAAGSTVGIVYVDRTEGGLEEELPGVKKLLNKAGLAFEILISREKILMS